MRCESDDLDRRHSPRRHDVFVDQSLGSGGLGEKRTREITKEKIS